MPIFERWDELALPLRNTPSENLIVGMLVSFEHPMRSLNPPTSSPLTRITGTLKRDPHLQFTLGEQQVAIRFDPHWLTTSTAFTDLHDAAKVAEVFAGLGLVVGVGENDLRLSALVFGKPQTAEAAAFMHIVRARGQVARTVSVENFEFDSTEPRREQ
jgi:hypothetical protein